MRLRIILKNSRKLQEKNEQKRRILSFKKVWLGKTI
mgnify:CR=1 FL=1